MLTIEQLTVRFGSITALQDIAASITAGKVTAVIGPNAAGKSTLLRALAGVQRPTAGAALLDGSPVQRLPSRTLARRLAYVAQRPTVAAAFTVSEVVALGRYALPPNSSAVRDAMQRLDLLDLAPRIVPKLSVGQQQRVAIARALAQHQRGGVLVLDEPTSALDMKHAGRCVEVLRHVASDGGTVVLSVHDLTMAASIADDVILLSNGRLAGHGPVSEVMTPEILGGVFGVDFELATRGDGSGVLLPAVR